MKRACKKSDIAKDEHNASSIRPIKFNFIRIKILVLILELTILINCTTVFSQFPTFTRYPLGETQELTGQTSLADVDKDGDMDWIVGSVDSVWWFEYQSAEKWSKHFIGTSPGSETGGIAMDVDGDGWIDQISGASWYKNPGDKNKAWMKYTSKAMIAQECVAGDFNGDGKEDVVMMSDEYGIIWYQFSQNPTKSWKSTKVGEGVRSGIGPMGAGDIDQDGDIDIVRSNCWYENLGGGDKWDEHLNLKLTHADVKYPNCTKSWLTDLDNDGDLDLVQAESFYPDCKVVWQNKQDKRGLTWYIRTVDPGSLQEIQSLAVADFDLDGDPDIFVGGSSRTKDFDKKCFIYENKDGLGKEWSKHQILIGFECHDAKAADVDGDGDVDIVGKPWYGTTNYYLMNTLK